MQVRKRGWFGIANVTAAFHSSGGATRYKNWQIGVIVYIGIPHAAAIQIQRMIEKRSVSFRSGLQFVQEVGKQRSVIGVNLGQLGELLRIVGVVRRGVVRVRDTDLGISPGAGLA